MPNTNQVEQIRRKLLELLKRINRSAQHYWVNLPDDHDKNWRAGWLDSLTRPKVWFLQSDPDPTELIKKLEKVILSK
jgi:hypothetical protein